VFDTERIGVGDWKSIPTVKEAIGADINYLMLRGIFGAPGMPKEAVEWYVAFFKKITDTPEWKKYMDDGALKPAFASGPEYVKWVEDNDKLHHELMTKGGLLKK
jgi:tripartite-type tricarboxylate transporter receptor subunit TctC